MERRWFMDVLLLLSIWMFRSDFILYAEGMEGKFRRNQGMWDPVAWRGFVKPGSDRPGIQLPGEVHEEGWGVTLTFLIFSDTLKLNLVAGTNLGWVKPKAYI
ncbi:hypothetical protein ACFQ49_06580 [Kroppenstedtia eburnea]|uniref:hypothetical protein n=1 Tax=Kroppenstedtia eburnea TaxID=714067 RepID=UPI00117ACCA5|nr:hypothetical protein [Kroppenstedtia eburnea]QKI83307.1 hypothetical protein GXN75_15655 [Kroppenstedtia eburnea]